MKPTLGHGFRLQWEAAQNAHVLLYPEGKRCDGQRTVAEITTDLERAFDAQGLAGDVEAFVSFAVEKGWLELRS